MQGKYSKNLCRVLLGSVAEYEAICGSSKASMMPSKNEPTEPKTISYQGGSQLHNS